VSQKSLNYEERGGNCLIVPERAYGPVWIIAFLVSTGQVCKQQLVDGS